MKVRNMTSPSSGHKVDNQFIITDDAGNQFFQSYNSIIAKIDFMLAFGTGKRIVTLDSNTWDYSVTTGKYRNQFLGETIKKTRAKIASGEYKLANLN